MSEVKKEILVLSKSKGKFNSNCTGYKSTKVNGYMEYNEVEISKDSEFCILKFNLYSKRVSMFVYSNGCTEVIEIKYINLLSKCSIVQEDTFKDVEGILVCNTEKVIFSKEYLREIVLYVSLSLTMFLAGAIIFG